MEFRRAGNTIEVEGAAFGYRDFEEGVINVLLDEDFAYELKDEGWNVKFPEKQEGDRYERQPYLPVAVRFGKIKDLWPEILVKKTRKSHAVQYDAEMVGNLTKASFESVNLVIRPRRWRDDFGETRIKAFLKSMYAILEGDSFRDAFLNYEED